MDYHWERVADELWLFRHNETAGPLPNSGEAEVRIWATLESVPHRFYVQGQLFSGRREFDALEEAQTAVEAELRGRGDGIEPPWPDPGPGRST